MTKKKIQPSDVLGSEYYNYNITSSNYTPSLNSSITITVTVTDVYNRAINNNTITLYRNGSSISSKSTNSSGVATWTYSCTSGGLQKFSIGENSISVFVDNKSEVNHTHSNYLTSHQDISGKENTSNKVTSISSSSTDTQYPSAKAVYDIVGNIISIINGTGGN